MGRSALDRRLFSTAENNVLFLLARGYTPTRIARFYAYEYNTIRGFVSRARKKLRVETTAEAISIVVRLGILWNEVLVEDFRAFNLARLRGSINGSKRKFL